jgi:hypothetical protein
MSSIYKDLVESFGYTPVVEAISLDAIMAAVGQEKDEQKRAAALNDIAWKEKLPGLYDPVSGNFVRKQSMPASNRGGRYDIAATASSGDDKTLSGMGLIPNNATTTSPLGKLANKVTGKDGDAYDKDIRTASQAAAGNKPPSQAAQPGQVTDAGSEFGTKDAFNAKADADLQNLDIGFGPNQFTPGDNKPLGDIDIGFGPNQFTPGDNKPAPNKPVIPGQGGDMDAKRKKYAELLAKAKGGTPSQASVRKVDNAIDAKSAAPTSNTKSSSTTLVAGIPVVPGQPLNPTQMDAAKMMLNMGNKLNPTVQAAYDLANKQWSTQ